MTLPLYQIAGWQGNFENAKSLGYVKPQFVCVPNKHGGGGLSNVQAQPDGPAVYGIWMWLVQLCSRQTCGRYEKTKTRDGVEKDIFRSARAGYLTADGTKTGRRYSASEFANMFRCDILLIHRCLQVVQSPEVGFLLLIEGVPEHLKGSGIPLLATPVTESETSIPNNGEIAQDYSHGLGESSITNVSTEQNRTEQKEHAPSEGSQVTESETAVTATETDPIQHSEAKRLLTDLCAVAFPDEVKRLQRAIWPDDWNHELDEVLPLEREQWALIDWAYRLRPAEREKLNQHTLLRQTFGALLKNLRSEPQKIRSARQAMGLNGLRAPAEKPVEPDGWREAHLALYGDASQQPASFFQYPPSAQKEIREFLEKKKSEVVL